MVKVQSHTTVLGAVRTLDSLFAKRTSMVHDFPDAL